MGGFTDFLAGVASTIVGERKLGNFIINRLVTSGRNRPHPWSTCYDYIGWKGLTDRSFNARLLPAKHGPAGEAMGTSRPPAAELAKLFEALPEGQRLCPKSTMLFPTFAQYLTDGFLRTLVSNDPPFGSGIEDRRRTTSNHEIDLSPLYGRTAAQTRALRTMSEAPGQRGKLKSQKIGYEEFPRFLFTADGKISAEFADEHGAPLLDMPLGINNLPAGSPRIARLFAVGGDRANATPMISMMNTLWLREHNRLAGLLEAAFPAWDDERLFETARNIVIVMFIKLVVEEYINHISNAPIRFRADPSACWSVNWNRPNWMTAEFSLLYRWHSLVPQRMTWGGETVDGQTLQLDNSRLIDRGLVNSFIAVSANQATELGLQNSATFLNGVEQKSIKQARDNNIASYNDYCRAMKKDPPKSFEDLVGKSKDPAEKARRAALAARLKQLYGQIENLEFYVGLFAEPRAMNGPLPSLITAMVAMDAFSQALTNPLLSEHVYGNDENKRMAFTELGLREIEKTTSRRDILARNSTGLNDQFVGMTRKAWKRNES